MSKHLASRYEKTAGAFLLPALVVLGTAAWIRRCMPRRAPSFPARGFDVVASDGARIRGRHAAHGKTRLLVLAHPAVIGQDYIPLVELGETLYPDFDLVTFDFRGHGKSGGYLTPDLSEPAADLAAVLDHLRGYDYAWMGVVGFSLGGMAGIWNAAHGAGIDALVSISAPPHMPDIGPLIRHPRLVPLFLRLLGLRMRAEDAALQEVLDLVAGVAPTRLLLVHGEQEIFYPHEDFEALWEKACEPKERMVLAAGHAETGREAHLIAAWLRQAAGVTAFPV